MVLSLAHVSGGWLLQGMSLAQAKSFALESQD